MIGLRTSISLLLSIGIAVLLFSCLESNTHKTGFAELSASDTGIRFENTLRQNKDFNIIEYLYFYNGGGISIGDINNDGFQDIYFTGNQVPNKLYLNKGSFVFEDITVDAGVSGEGNWKTGTTMADVNGDGLLDIFVCGVGNYKNFHGKNQLFINNGDLTFTESAEQYGLAFQGFSTQAVFFDYDNDGDLDMYLLNHSVHTSRSYGHSRLRLQSDPHAGDKLYRNDVIPGGVPIFTEVTSVSGIYNSQIAYGLGVGVSDLNKDGWADIYVSNDFHENDYLYINQRDGTFREELAESIPHVSRFSMGNDIADINNDAMPDIMTLDMLPRDEEVIKTTAGEDPYDIYEFKLRFGYHHQFARNTLQLNQGFDEEGHLRFSDIGALAGVEASDWSWAPLIADFDNDGFKDIFIANGIVTRPNDLDYINFISTDSARKYYDHKTFIKKMPAGEVPNLFFRNQGNLRFSDVSNTWIGSRPTASTGAAYADLDNDGDLDLVVNNINEAASIFRNDIGGGSWLQLELVGDGANRFGIGSKVIVYAGGRKVYHELSLTHGWQSSVSPVIHCGTGSSTTIDSVTVIWPTGKFQMLRGLATNQRLKIYQKNAEHLWRYTETGKIEKKLNRISADLFTHKENDYNAFNSERLIPHMVSTQGPDISVGDVNGDGLEDFFVGGAAGQAGAIFLQTHSANFAQMNQPAIELDSASEDVGSALFDADGDGMLDLLVVGGGQEFPADDPALRPRLYLNNGNGVLRKSDSFSVLLNASCVAAGDVDGDHDIDVFIGGRVIPGAYGQHPRSYLFINDGHGNFKDESFRLAGNDMAFAPGMVTDAVFCDLNGDARIDLLIVGEWMPITAMVQDEDGNFLDRSSGYGFTRTNGWWNAVHANDFDGDGDVDFVVGNLGLNSRLRASQSTPVKLYVGDIDGNGGIDHLLTYYNNGKQHPFISRDQLVKQVPSFRRDFLKYKAFRNVTLEQIIPPADTPRYVVDYSYTFASVYLENRDGQFYISELPVEAQMFPIFSFTSGDFNEDGKTDLLAAGNLFSVQPDLGRYDGGYGLMLLGNGAGDFTSVSLGLSGFEVRGEGRDIKKLRLGEREIILVARSNGALLVFE